MNVCQRYLEKLSPTYLLERYPNDFRADMIVVIPSYNEKDLLLTLRSLLSCQPCDARVLVAVILNSGEFSAQEGIQQNRVSYDEVLLFAHEHNSAKIRFSPLLFEELPRKHAGVGLARKIGMDLAIQHFVETNNSRGVIISLDADCTVSPNFLTDIYSVFREKSKLNATIHNFRHSVENQHLEIENAIRQYEVYIRYFSNSLKTIGFPYYYHTIGSAFAVSANVYARVGGMGRQQGGEDFYFLQKVFALNNIIELEKVFVYPMARFSERVPFGTGPALQKIIDEPDHEMKVYSRASFRELAYFFELKDAFFKRSIADIEGQINTIHPSLRLFIQETNVISQIADCNENSATINAYRKRFFHHFNAFKIIKYLNFAHPNYFPFEKISSVC